MRDEPPPDCTPAPGDTLLFANERVRVWSMTLPPGQLYDYHQHHHDHVILWPAAGSSEAQALGDDDWYLEQEAEAGYVAFKTVGSDQPLTPHRIRNRGAEATTHYVVELLGTSPSPQELPAQTNGRGRSVDTRTGQDY